MKANLYPDRKGVEVGVAGSFLSSTTMRVLALQKHKRITKIVIKANKITIIKLSIIECLVFLNRVIRIVLIAC